MHEYFFRECCTTSYIINDYESAGGFLCYFFPQKNNKEGNSGFVVSGYSLLYS
jgi:hypothetical protein